MVQAVKKQLAIDGRLSHAKDLSVKEVKLILTLLHRYFTQLAKTLGKKSPKGSDAKALFTQIQKEAPNPNWTPAQYERYIKRLKKLQTAAANQNDTKGLSESAKKIVAFLDEICKLFCTQEKGFNAVNKKPAKVVIRKKRGKDPRPLVPGCPDRLDNIIMVIGSMEAEGDVKITASSISQRMQKDKLDVGKNSNANVRACLREHRLACGKSGKPVFVAFNSNPGGHEYYLTPEGKKRYQELPGKIE